MTIFKGYEKARYQEHDDLIDTLVDGFNADKATAIGATSDQASGISDLTADLVKAWIIQETGGGDAASKAAWAVDPSQVNVPGDWSDYKKSLGLTEPTKPNTGNVQDNLKAGIGWLARKGFGKSGQPPKNRPEGSFDGWSKALERYNGRGDQMSDGRPYREHYAERVLARAADPSTHFPIELGSVIAPAVKRALPRFDTIVELLQRQSPRFDEIEVDAAVAHDGSTYLLLLNPADPLEAVQVPADAVRLGEELPSPRGLATSQLPVRRVWVRRGTPVLRLTTMPFESVVGSALPLAGAATLRASVDFRANGEGTLQYNGKSVPCLGRPGVEYAKDLTVQGVVGTDKFRTKHSTEFDVDMEWAVLIMGNRGIYIHQGPDNLQENEGVSAGCIHVKDGQDFYDWVSGKTRILISCPW